MQDLPRRGQGVGATQLVNRPTDWFNALPPMMKMQPYSDLVSSGSVPRPLYSATSTSPLPGIGVWLCPQATDMPGTYYWSFGMNMALSIWEVNSYNNGQPNKITVIFGRKVTRQYRGKLQSVIEDIHLPNPVIRSHYGNGFIKQICSRSPAVANRSHYQ